MTTTDDVTPIRISGPAGLLAVVPSMLGFHPTNSLVLMCLSGGRRRVGPVARVDLAKGHDRATAEHLANHARLHADEVVVISYQDSRRRPPMLDDLLSALARAGIDVMDAMVVRGGRVRPALNAAMERAHPGVPVPDADDPQVRQLAAAGALAGRTVLSDRDQLRRSIAGPRGARLAQARRHIDEAAAGRLPTVGDSPPDDDPAAETPHGRRPDQAATTGDSREHVLRSDPFRTRSNACGAGVPANQRDRGSDRRGGDGIGCDAHRHLVRDTVMIRAVAEIDRPWLPMLIASATWTPDALAAPLCSVLAMVAYRHGDGALAQIAVDRCLAAEPRNSLAHLMIAIMSAGVRPEELERIARAGLDPTEPSCDDLGRQHAAGNDLDDDWMDDDFGSDDDPAWGDDRAFGGPDSGVSPPFWN